jgi:catalase
MEQRDSVAAATATLGQLMAQRRSHNGTKPLEFGTPDEIKVPEGEHDVAHPEALQSTAMRNSSPKIDLAVQGSLASSKAGDPVAQLTTNHGVAVSDNQSSLKAGVRGPTLLEDFILREKLTHFDHERIPERVVHARGAGAHGYFECTRDLTAITRAVVFSEVGKRTPVFVRFSTVAGERGSADTARDVRGFAVKFYTEEGNWDLVGNNMPVFFIQDAMKFPDLVHAVRPEPHHGIPQASSAHDTFWDFVSLMPESTHMLCWLMSDRALPRSYRMMQGFGVHTFRFVNASGESTLVKFHWTPRAGVHSLVWDEAMRISGADPDFHRRDLWNAIEAGNYPEWELGVQLINEAEAEHWSFDVLDPTKLVPEELSPVVPVGRLVLNRNPDNFFAETEQVAFCTAHVVPGVDFTNDPLLAGRHHSYLDTQLSRLGGPNFHEIPINAPLAPVANNQRDGLHRRTINRGRVAYEPNSLAGGCPFQAGMRGFVNYPAPVPDEHKLRGKPQRFAEHYAQARLFVASLTAVELRHLEDAFAFELGKVAVPAIRSRMLSHLRLVDDALATRLATRLAVDLPSPATPAGEIAMSDEVQRSKRLSQLALPGDGGLEGRRVAILVAGSDVPLTLVEFATALAQQGLVVTIIGPTLSPLPNGVPVDASFDTSPSVLFDAVILPGSRATVECLMQSTPAREFVELQFRHFKPICIVGSAPEALELPLPFPLDEDGVLVTSDAAEARDLIRQHRYFERGN